MTPGISKWNDKQAFYDSLTLHLNGDAHEMHATKYHGIETRLKNYVRFWRRHVCPATERSTTDPNAIKMRASAHDIVYDISQRSHGVLVSLTFALDDLENINQHGFGDRQRNFYSFVKFAGDSLQLFTELGKLVGRKVTKDDPAADTLSALLGGNSDPFPDWATNLKWKSARETAVGYRNYLTHSGIPYSREAGMNGIEVLTQSTIVSVKKLSHSMIKSLTNKPSNLIDLNTLCTEIEKDTIAFLDEAYMRLCDTLDAVLLHLPLGWDKYVGLWGWDVKSPKLNVGPLSTGPSSSNSGCTNTSFDL